jgi:beta-galactosidase
VPDSNGILQVTGRITQNCEEPAHMQTNFFSKWNRTRWIVAGALLVGMLAMAQQPTQPTNPYRNDLYQARHATPMQERIRHLQPFPVCVVYWQPASTTSLEQVRAEFQQIHDAGFHCLKTLQLIGNLPQQEVFEAALDAGLTPWWYGEAGWEDVTPELLERLHLPRSMPLREALTNPAMIAYQTQRYRDKIEHPVAVPPSPYPDHGFRRGQGGYQLKAAWISLFAQWLEKQYGTLPVLEQAWNFAANRDEVHPATFRDAAILAGGDGSPNSQLSMEWDFRRYRDILKFEAEQRAFDLKQSQSWFHQYDPLTPQREGGELAMFQNFAAIGTDQALVADVMADGGSFYPSIHPAHHFEAFTGEVALPVYLESQLTVDLSKGMWTGAWESTGMPSVYSGSYGYAATPGFISQMMLSYIAAGMRGIGIWAWNMRDAGWESGEYSLVDRQGHLTSWGKQAGQIAKAVDKYRFELWDARNEPTVGILYSWENMATAARLSVGAYPVDRGKDFGMEPTRAVAGAAEAFQQANIPFEFVTEVDLKAGLAQRYKAIYLPHEATLSKEMLPILLKYVQEGGRVVADVPAPWWDEFGRVQETGPGSPFESIFGVTVNIFQGGRNVRRSVDGKEIEGTYADLSPSSAVKTASFDTGGAAITEVRHGRGSASYIAFEASLLANETGKDKQLTAWARKLIVHTTVPSGPLWTVSGVTAYRRVAPHAHHYFLINDGPATDAVIKADNAYSHVVDAVTGEDLGGGDVVHVNLDANSARWVRAELP